MRPSSLGGGRILRRTLSVHLSVRLSVCLSVRPSRYRSLPSVTSRHLANYNDTHVRAAYRTAISASQILVVIDACLWRSPYLRKWYQIWHDNSSLGGNVLGLTVRLRNPQGQGCSGATELELLCFCHCRVWHLSCDVNIQGAPIKSIHLQVSPLLITQQRFKLTLQYFAGVLIVYINIHLPSYISLRLIMRKTLQIKCSYLQIFGAFSFELTNSHFFNKI